MPRLDTRLEAVGAEFLVLGNLLIAGIAAYKAYQNWKGYDLLAVNPARNTSARIQVKSRWATDMNGFLIRQFDCDFVILVALNRGFRYRKVTAQSTGAADPVFYVMTVDHAKELQDKKSKWGRIPRDLLPADSINAWQLIREFLDAPASAVQPRRRTRRRDG